MYMNSPFRGFMTDLEKDPTSRTTQTPWTSTLCVILNIFQNCPVFILLKVGIFTSSSKLCVKQCQRIL